MNLFLSHKNSSDDCVKYAIKKNAVKVCIYKIFIRHCPHLSHCTGKSQQTLQEYLQEIPDLDDSDRELLTDDFRFFDANGDDVLSVSDLQHNFNIIDHNRM